MRTLTLYLTVFLCGSGVTLLAQTTDEIELTRSVIQTEKKAIVAANMHSSPKRKAGPSGPSTTSTRTT